MVCLGCKKIEMQKWVKKMRFGGCRGCRTQQKCIVSQVLTRIKKVTQILFWLDLSRAENGV
jgi:hypothetical protein